MPPPLNVAGGSAAPARQRAGAAADEAPRPRRLARPPPSGGMARPPERAVTPPSGVFRLYLGVSGVSRVFSGTREGGAKPDSLRIRSLVLHRGRPGTRRARFGVDCGDDATEAVRGACKPGSVQPLRAWATIPLEPMSPSASRGQPGGRSGNPLPCGSPPYSALLPVGFAVPPPLLEARWALTPPFHPCPWRPTPFGEGRRGRSVLCGTFPEVALAGRWPAPSSRGARTFLQRGIAPPPAAARPPGTTAFVRPGGAPGQALRVKPRRPPAPPPCARASRRRRCRPPAPGANAAGRR